MRLGSGQEVLDKMEKAGWAGLGVRWNAKTKVVIQNTVKSILLFCPSIFTKIKYMIRFAGVWVSGMMASRG